MVKHTKRIRRQYATNCLHVLDHFVGLALKSYHLPLKTYHYPLQKTKNRPQPATSLKKSFWYRCFPVNFANFLRTPFAIEHLRWLLLKKKLYSLFDVVS